MSPVSSKSPIRQAAFPSINRTYKNLNRMRQILTILGKHGFSQLIETVGLARIVPFLKKEGGDTSRKSISEKLCMAFEELGPTFVKLGQMFASRPDLVTPEFARSFQRLRDDVKGVPFSEIRKVIEDELEETTSALFTSLEESPLAAASIAQVHGAILPDAKEAVVKIQRPGVQKLIETDVSILYLFAKLVEKYLPEAAAYDPVAIVEEFARVIQSATDFIQEGHNIDEIRQNFSESSDIVIPEIQWELTSKRVLTMERIHGIPIHDVERLKKEGCDLKKVVRTGVRAFLEQVFIHGVFHADLHGGNLFVLPEDRLAFVDFGEVGRLGSHAQSSIANIFVSLMTRDFQSLAREYVDLGTPQAPVDVLRFADDLERLLSPLFGRTIRDVDLGSVLGHAAQIASDHRIRLPRDLVLIGRVIITMEDQVRKLDPEFDLLEFGGEFAADVIRKKFRPEKLAKDLLWNLKDVSELSRTLPTQIKYVVQKLSSNDLTFKLDIEKLSRATQMIDVASRRLAFAIVIMGLVIASSILTFSSPSKNFLGVTGLGVFGYAVAGILGFFLLFSIMRSGKL